MGRVTNPLGRLHRLLIRTLRRHICPFPSAGGSTMTRLGIALLAAALLVSGPAWLFSQSGDKNDRPAAGPTEKRADIDLALCLDTSNSMDGLIDAAKQKLWDLVNTLARARPTPNLRVALYSYGNTHYDA